MVFINKSESGISKIGALDQLGIISVWSVIEINEYGGLANDLNINLGCKYKMVALFSDNLFLYDNVIDFTNDNQI